MGQKLKLSWFRKHKIVSIFLVLLVLILGGSLYQGYAERKNRQAFQQARAAIDTIYADIVAKVGPPDNSKRHNECSRPSQEFEQGPLSCDVSTEFIYAVKDKRQASDLFKRIQATIGSHPGLLRPAKKLASPINSRVVINTYFHTAVDKYKTTEGMDCSVKYVYDTPLETPLTLTADNKKTFYTTIGCTDWARSEYY